MSQHKLAVADMSWQVIDLILEKMRLLIGEGALSVLQEIKNVDRSSDPSPELVYRLSNELGDLLGAQGAFAVIRQVGREIGVHFSEGKGAEAAKTILQETLRGLGFAYEIRLDESDAYICSCVFHRMIEAEGARPIEKPVCWAGWGFIEGCLKEINQAHHIRWRDRNEQKKECRFEIMYDLD